MEQLSWQAWLTLSVIGSVLLVLITTAVSADFVLMGGFAILVLAGVVDASHAFEVFGSEGLITIGLLYVVVAGLQETGVLTWISLHVLGHPSGRFRAQLRLMLPVTALSAFLNNTPVVAMFIPVVTEWSRRIQIAPSRLMIPLSYAAIMGGICTLIGTSTNLIVAGLYHETYSGETMGMFEITKLGLPCALLGVAYILIVGKRWLPDRETLRDVFRDPREYALELKVEPHSPVVGKSIEASGLRHLPGAFLAELIRGNRVYTAVSPDETLQPGDQLVFVGNIESMRTLYHQQGLSPASSQQFKLDAPKSERCLVEAVVSDTCPIVGKSIREGRFRNLYNAVVIAVARNGQRLTGKIGDIVLKAGDTLLIESHAGFIPRQRDSRDFYLISQVEDSTPRRFEKAPWALAILTLMVLIASTGLFSMLKAALISAILMLLTGCVTPYQARRSVEWNVLLAIGAALGLSMALGTSGAASILSGLVVGMTRDDPRMTLLLICLMTSLMTEVITNNGTAALIFPVAISAADTLQVSPMPFIISIMICASASFSTPIGYQTNLMIYGPGGYQFKDYLRIGIPLNIMFVLLSALFAPMIWSF